MQIAGSSPAKPLPDAVNAQADALRYRGLCERRLHVDMVPKAKGNLDINNPCQAGISSGHRTLIEQPSYPNACRRFWLGLLMFLLCAVAETPYQAFKTAYSVRLARH